MKALVLLAATAGVLLATPLVAVAADTMMADHSAMMTSMMCRPAIASEKTGTMMMGKTSVVCKTITPEMMKKIAAGPDLSGALTTMQVNAAWKAYVEKQLEIPSPAGGG